MRVFRRTYTVDGVKRTSKTWYLDFVDGLGIERRLAGFSDKTRSHELAGIVKRLAVAQGHNEHPTADLMQNVKTLPERIRKALVTWGIVDQRRDADARLLREHVEAFCIHLTAKGNQASTIDLARQRVQRVLDGIGAVRWGDITEAKVETYLTGLQEAGEDVRALSAQSFTHYVRAIKQFCRWMVRTGRATRSPLEGLGGQNARAARKRVRRYLLHEEWPWLLHAAETGPERYGMAGAERALLYATAIQTGLRAKELRSLIRTRAFLAESRPYILAPAGTTKNRKTARQHIEPRLAEKLNQYAQQKLPMAPLFAMPDKYKTADMLREDLAAARTAWITTAGDDPAERMKREQSDFLAECNHDGAAMDFHSLRHTCGAWLAMAGTHIKGVQSVMRHCSITLTMDTYGHLFPGQEAEAVAKLGGMMIAADGMKATGTASAKPAPTVTTAKVVPRVVRNSGGTPRTTADGTATMAGPAKEQNERGNKAFLHVSPVKSQLRWDGRAVECAGLENR